MPLSLDFSARFWSNRVMTNRTSPANQFISHTPHTHTLTQSVEIVPACLGRDVSRRHDDDTLTIILLACLLSVECDCAVLGKRQEASGKRQEASGKAARRQGFYLLGLAETLRCAPQPFGRPL